MNIIARMCNVEKTYGEKENSVKALNDVNINISEGEFIGILGASGSGKSTFLNILGGLEYPTSGDVYINNIKISELSDDVLTELRRKQVGFVFQEYNLIPVLSVYENIVLPIQLGGEQVDEGYVNEILTLLDLEDKQKRLPAQLSGGQQQRVAIARALAKKPTIILADEPTGNLDSRSTLQVMDLLKKSAKQFRQTIVLITHNESLTSYCNRIFRMSDGVLLQETEELPGE